MSAEHQNRSSDERWTERRILDLIHVRYSQTNPGNGPRYVVAEHVKSAAGFDARRQADAIVQDLWPSTGLPLHGHEVKVSRSDWLTELKDPSKADAFRRYMDYWWLVVPDAEIVRDDLPDGWGLMVAWRRPMPRYGVRLAPEWTLRVVKQAPELNPEPLPVAMRAALLRATAITAARKSQREAA